MLMALGFYLMRHW